MTAVLKHELRSYFHSLTAYVFGAFLLAFIGIGAMRYNLQAAVSNFEYVISFVVLLAVVIVPVLTMCSTPCPSPPCRSSPGNIWPCWCCT